MSFYRKIWDRTDFELCDFQYLKVRKTEKLGLRRHRHRHRRRQKHNTHARTHTHVGEEKKKDRYKVTHARKGQTNNFISEATYNPSIGKPVQWEKKNERTSERSA